ncbi:ABC transporter permease [Cesiribacter sp. SM1]|uniref:ABC transporter permease n=1 Tax=Cesiribacter sp. SM1 TaxID=2861196 RepID=UPI001CD78AD8|nr:ABC transporter permease [Cesiribacter sp. SM1]
MYSSFLKTAIRNVIRHKAFSFLNIAGLTFGLTACILIGLFVQDEMQFDKFIPEGSRIHRVYYQITTEEGTSQVATTPPMFATALQQEFPEVENTLRVLNNPNKELFEVGDTKLYEEGGILAEQNFFEIFPLQLTYGSAVAALEDPNSVVISQELARKYFGDKNPVGKKITISKSPFQVSGVFQNNPKFHLPITYIFPLVAAGIAEERMQSWDWYSFNNYVKLKQGADVEGLQAKFQRYTQPFLQGDETTTYLPLFQPLHDIHLYSADFRYDMAVRGNIIYVKALIVTALFILVIACFNFVNLATAKSLQRAKEVGVRKTIGANRSQLMVQFILETIFLTLISVVLATLFAWLFLPLLNQFTEKQIAFDLLADPMNVLLLLLLAVLVGVLAGFYPALVLSGFQPVKVLKGTFSGDSRPGKTPWLRHGLVVIQFSLSVLLIISAIVVRRQVTYLHSKELGFEKEQIMFFPMRGERMSSNVETFKNELLQSPFIEGVTVGYGFPGDMFGDGMMTVPGKGEQKKATQLMVDHDYIKTLGLELVAGRDFSREMKTDKDHGFIINETAVKELGLGTPEQALGETLLWPTWRNADSVKRGQVIGVVKDFHYKSLYERVEPAVLQIYPQAYWKVAVKIKAAGIEKALPYVKEVWEKFSPEYPLEYNFLDESFDKMYKAEDKLRSLLWIFSGVAIFVGCLGLFGLAAYAAERRTKEIGIRKVLGASSQNIVLLLSGDFVKLVLISILIASPVAWYFMQQWLQDFAYRINISWWIFVVAGLSAIAIALVTVSFHAIRAALRNPVRNLRTE